MTLTIIVAMAFIDVTRIDNCTNIGYVVSYSFLKEYDGIKVSGTTGFVHIFGTDFEENLKAF